MSFRILRFVLLVVIAYVGTGAARARAELGSGLGPGIIAAIVRDAQGRPVAGVHVVATGPTERDADTTASGYVALQALPLGRYVVRAVRGGYDPVEQTVSVVAAATTGFKVLDLRIAPASFAVLRPPAGASIATAPLDGVDPNVAQQLGNVSGVALVPAVSPAAAGASLFGVAPAETRTTLDGIPLPGGATLPALRARSALPLAAVQIADGTFTGNDLSPRNAIGGTINYQTPPISTAQNLSLSAGFDSNFGSYQQLHYSHSSGALGYDFDAVTGSGANRAQTLKVAYDLSKATSLDVAVYGSQSSGDPSLGLAAINAPAYALGLRTSLDTGTVRVRTYGSSLGDDRIRGNQIAYDLPVGNELLSVGYDRNTETLSQGPTSFAQTTSALTVRGEAPLTQSLRFSVADVFSSGGGTPARTDPQAGLVYRANDALTLRASAGSAFATQGPGPVNPAAGAVSNLPETAFGYRLSADARVTSLDTLSLEAFRIDRFDNFANLSNARSSGLVLGYSHALTANGLSVQTYATALRSYAFGSAQPLSRYQNTGTVALDGVQFAGMPYASGRVALAYRRASGIGVTVGTSYYGANSGLGATATTLTDAALALPLGTLATAQLGVHNLFGRALAPSAYYLYGAPGELTLSLGRNFGR